LDNKNLILDHMLYSNEIDVLKHQTDRLPIEMAVTDHALSIIDVDVRGDLR
jgi:hypothetical protein